MKVNFEIGLINRINPVGMEGYKKAWKPKMELRTCETDHLNKFRKETEEIIPEKTRAVWSAEILRLQDACSDWKIQKNPDFGDLLVGYISITEFPEFYREIYLPVRPIKQ